MLGRMRLLLAFLFTVLAVFTGRLMFLQLVRTEEYALRSIQNSLAQKRITPLRGRILARDGTVLADDRVAYDLMYTGGEAPEWERIKALLGVEGELRPPDPRKPEEAQNGAVAVWNIPDESTPWVRKLQRIGRVRIHARVTAKSLGVGDPFRRPAAQQRLAEFIEHLQAIVPSGAGVIPFDHREFGIVQRPQFAATEDPTDLIDRPGARGEHPLHGELRRGLQPKPLGNTRQRAGLD